MFGHAFNGGKFLPAMWAAASANGAQDSDGTRGDVVGTIGGTMTAIFAPNPTMDRTQPVEESAEEIALQLSARSPERMWGAVGSFFVSIFTFGLLPLFVWPRRWNVFVQRESNQMISVAEWWRRRAAPEQVGALDACLGKMGPQPFFTIVPMLVLVFAGIMLLSLVNDGRTMRDLMQMTFNERRHLYWMGNPVDMSLHLIWITSLSIGYFCHWFAVRSHAAAVESLAATIDGFAGPKRPRSIACSSGLNPLWIGLAIVFCGMHAWWGIPFAMAGALQRKYVRSTSPQLRNRLVEQLRNQNGGAATFKEVCQTPGCGAPVRLNANYCPRCGTAV
jgi:hypothetical protein